MSNIFIRDIVGSNDFAVPTNDTELATATTELDAIVSGVSNLSYDVLIAWVETKDGGSAPRSLNASVQTFEYSGEECPDSTEVQTMTTAIKAALEADVDITSIGEQQVSLFQVSQVQPWLRDSGGFVHTRVATDDIYVGGATPNAVLFDDGDAVFGGSAMSGTEKLRVVGAGRIEGKLTVTGLIDPTGLKCTEQSADPGATGAGEGTFWVKDDSPSTPYFTDDTGADHNLLAGGGSSPWSETAGVLYPTTFGTDDVVVGANAMVGAERFRVAGDARVDSGTLGVRVAPSAIASVYAQDDLSTTATTRAFWATQASVVTGTKAAWEGLLVQCGHTGTGTITDAWGVEVGFTAGSKGTYTRAYGLQTGANLADVDDNIGTYRGIYCGPMSGSGDITNSYGVDIADQGLSSTVAIGVYIRDQTATTAYGVFQSGADDLNIFSGFMELGQDLLLNEHSDHQSTPAAGKGIVWLKDDAPNTLWFTDDAGTDFQIGGAGGGNVWNYSAGVISPANNSDDDTVVVGTTTMSGSGEMVRAYCDPGEGENIGFLANDDDTDFIGGVFTGFLAKGINTTAFSNQFTGFQVDAPTAGFLGAIGYGFVCSDMAGTGLSGMTAFYQVGVNEVNEFRGSSGFGGGASGSMAVRAHTKSSGISSAFTNVQAYRNVNNTTSSPGPDWTAFDAYIVQPFVATAHYIRDVWFYKVTSPASSVAVTIRNAYGLYIEDLQADADFTYTNPPYGIYQAGSGEGNFLNGNTGVGTQPTVGHKLRVSGDVYHDGGQVGLGTAPDASITLKVGGDAWITDQVGVGATVQSDAQAYVTKSWAPGSSQALRTIVEAVGDYNDSGFTLADFAIISAEGTCTAGTVTELFNFKAYSPTGTSTITNAYGLFVEAQNVSGVGSAWGIYQAGSSDDNYFAGDVGIGVTIPAYALDISGAINIRGGNSLRLNGSASGVATLTADADASQVDCSQDFNVASGKVYRVNGSQVLTAPISTSTMSTADDGSQDGVARTKINEIINNLKTHGLFS